VLAVTTAPDFGGWDVKLDQRLALGDPHNSWQSIPLHADGKWSQEGCSLLPITCGILKELDDEFSVLFATGKSFKQKVGLKRLQQGYDEVPTLGIKLYKVHPKTGIKDHTGRCVVL
jgi:hypothetical protein